MYTTAGGVAGAFSLLYDTYSKANVLFADEPTGALNSASSAAVLDVFTSLHDKGQSIVMVTHDKN